MQKYQGDVSIIKATAEMKKSASTLTFTKQKTLTVAEGEVTGHHHTIVADDLEFAPFQHGYFVRAHKGILTHQEHDVQELEEGELYFLGRQYEYDPVEKYRRVQD